MISLLLASKGILLYSVSSSVLTGVALGVVYKRFATLKKDHAQQIHQLQATQKELEARLATMQPMVPSPTLAEPVTVLSRAQATNGDVDSTKGMFLKHLLQANVQLQAEA